jgi:phosphoribosylformimino-5-aminoimidazole carboxamide ribonucleotide (ProFAR) isomerase
VNGINLLLYRYVGDQKMLLNEAVEKLKVPLIVAGNVATFEQLEELKKKNVWTFTIGGAIFERRFVKEGDIHDQIIAVLGKL